MDHPLYVELHQVGLEVLAGTEGALSVPQIVRIGGRGMRQGLMLALDRLVSHGLVLALPSSRGRIYQLNRQHVLAEEVLSDIDGLAEVAGDGEDIVQSWLEDCITVLGDPIEQLVQRARSRSVERSGS